MLVTFRTKGWGDITMFGDVAVTLLKMAGHSGTIPSALRAADVSAALARLNQALAAAPAEDKQPAESGADDADAPPVGIRLRAYPLTQLLAAAAKQECDVMWDTGAPLI